MGENTPTDADLVADTLAGNREAFGQLYDRYARLVRAVVAGVAGDWPAADDMVQECFLRAYRKLSTLRDPPRFGSWIVGIARQVGRERRRSLHRDRHEFRDHSLQVESTEDFAAIIGQRDEIELVIRMLNELEEQERVALHAFFLQQQDAQQAAGLLGLSRSGYYALVQRALTRLAARLQPRETKQEASR